MAELSRVEEIFTEALKKSPSERGAFLDGACCGEAELRAQVERLLAAVPNAKAFLETPTWPQPDATVKHHSTEMAGRVIAGKYKLLEPVGEGGMGTVWKAQQSEPVRRLVAVKLIKAGMDSKSVLARFEAERQALALMDHPNIAKVLDGGLTEDARPYFVMELVKGVPITEYCDKQRLTPRQRLELFIPVCQAIQHAHQKGIIHRDIKPSNVMIAMYDDRPVPKVIDFGVAKATGAQLTEQTINTGLGGIVGTPQYMSPEQAAINNLDIDTRTDVYSLGVVLYELLAGSPPFKRKELERAGYLEILRIVREEDPPKPSTKLSTADTLASLSASRSMEPKKLTGLLRSELDWIVMKALEKVRTRRYETANGFAMDINRYLAGEPVMAHPPNRTYRMRKFLRKNRGAALAVAVVLLVLVGGILGTSWGLVQARRSAEAERTAATLAQQRLGQVERGMGLLSDIFHDLDPQAEGKAVPSLRVQLGERLDGVVGQLDAEAIADPLTVTKLHLVLGDTQRGLGFPDKAMPLLRKAEAAAIGLYGPDDLLTLKIQASIAQALNALDQFPESIRLFESVLTRQRDQLGPDHPDARETANNLGLSYLNNGQYTDARTLYRDTLARYQAALPRHDQKVLTVMNNLAMALNHCGQADQAVPLYEEILTVRRVTPGPRHAGTLVSMSNLALAYLEIAKPAKAVPLLEEAFEGLRAEFGADFPETLTAQNNLALALGQSGNSDKAIAIFDDVLARRIRKNGSDHSSTLIVLQNLAFAYLDKGQFDKAIGLFEQVLERKTAKAGPDHPDTLVVLNNLGLAHARARDYAKAVPLQERAARKRAAQLGETHPLTLLSLANLAQTYRDMGQYDRAVAILAPMIPQATQALGADHPQTIIAYVALGVAHQMRGRHQEAVPLLETAVQLSREKYTSQHALTLERINCLAQSYQHLGRLAEAAALFDEAVTGLLARDANPAQISGAVGGAFTCYRQTGEYRKLKALAQRWLAWIRDRRDVDPLYFSGELAAFGLVLLQQKQWTEAEPVLREALDIRAKAIPKDWRTANSRSMLGEALMGQDKLAEAEPLLRDGCRDLKAAENSIPPFARRPRLQEALERLIQLARAQNKPDDIAKWQSEFATLPRELAPPPRRMP